MSKTLTLAIDDELLRQARRYAAEHDTTVNGLVRDYLARLVDERVRSRTARERLANLSAASDWQRDPQWRWNREEIHADRGFPGHERARLRRVARKGGQGKASPSR